MQLERVFAMSFASIYPHYVAKVEGKGRTRAELDEVVCWLTGYDAKQLAKQIQREVDLRTFFKEAPKIHPKAKLITGTICGVPTRLFRVSFTGEIGYEINVPADYALSVWEALWARGQEFGITPYGTEAMHVLRAERGFIIVGQETDGTVTPDDAGLAGMIARAKADFVGKRSLARPDMLKPDRRQLVGLLADTPDLVLEEGAQIVADPRQPIPMTMLGHVTSSYWSDACGRAIALALVSGGRARLGETLHVTTPAGFAPARVAAPVFFDPKGERAHG